MNKQVSDDIIHAAFFFVDIVGLSNPVLSTETQRTKIMILNQSIYECPTFLSEHRENLFVLPTGDGMLIGFKDSLEQPIKLAIELHNKLRKHNQDVPDTEKIAIRIGCNVGNVFLVKDVFGNVNLWGPGAILARRVMDLGDENHILLTSSMADDLKEISEEYEKILHPIHDYKIKHSEEILVYNVYGQNFGNQNLPKKSLEKNKTADVKNLEKNAICEKTIFNIRTNNLETNLLKHERIYYFANNSVEPVYSVSIEILTKSKREFPDLNVKIFDEGEELRISRVATLSPSSYALTIKLSHPVFKGDSGRMIKVYYEDECPYRYFENLFLTDTTSFELNFAYPYNGKVEPKFYFVDLKNNAEKQIEESKRMVKGVSKVIQWQKENGVDLHNMIRLEW